MEHRESEEGGKERSAMTSMRSTLEATAAAEGGTWRGRGKVVGKEKAVGQTV